MEVAHASLKHAVTAHAPARRKGRMEQLDPSYLRTLQRNPEQVKTFFQKNTDKYAARSMSTIHGRINNCPMI